MCFNISTAPKKVETTPSGKYYADDGPPESVPDNLAAIPDAVPRDEPFHKFANRPYTVFGQTYVPVVNKDATKERGLGLGLALCHRILEEHRGAIQVSSEPGRGTAVTCFVPIAR